MTPAEEMEYIIKEITVNDGARYYTIKSFPEIFFLKYEFHYMVEILEDYRQNNIVNERFKALRDEIESRKITIENQIVYTDRNILFNGKIEQKFVPIYYKNCIFTYPHTLIGTNCENCIFEKGGET